MFCLDGFPDNAQSYLHQLPRPTEDFPNGLDVQQIEGAGHFLHQEKPDTVNTLILNWIQRWQNMSGE
ncbi:MAG: alpha/beta fold hydrolase [Pseudomonadales bacterium]